MSNDANQIIGQLAILTIQHVFTMLKMSGKSPEEIEIMFKEELIKFKARPIEDLPLPPK